MKMCIHHWNYDRKDYGVCKLCGAEHDGGAENARVFNNRDNNRYDNYLKHFKVATDYPMQGRLTGTSFIESHPYMDLYRVEENED